MCDPSDDNEDHYFPYPRLYRVGTTLVPEAFASLRDRKRNNTGIACNGVWVDIFLFHRFETLEEIREAKERSILLRKRYLYSKKEKIVGREHGLPRKLIALGQNAYSRFVNRTQRAPEKAIWEKYMALFAEKGELVTTVDYPYDDCPEHTALRMDEIFPLKEVRFDRLTVKVPKEFDKNLRNIYGDYMELPPVDNRVNHAPEYLDLNG